MSACFIRLHVCDVIQFRDDHARFWRWKFRMRNSYPMDRMSSILLMSNDGCSENLIVFCCVFRLLFFVMFYFEASFRAPRELVRWLNLQGSHILIHIFIYILAFVSAPQTTPRTAIMCGNIPSCFAPLDDRGNRTNQLHLLKLLHTSKSSSKRYGLLLSRQMFSNRNRSKQLFR